MIENKNDENYELTPEELEEILAGEAEYKMNYLRKLNQIQEILLILGLRTFKVIKNMDIENAVSTKKHMIITAFSKDFVEEFIIRYTKIKSQFSDKKTSVISASKLNLKDIKDLYSKYLIVYR